MAEEEEEEEKSRGRSDRDVQDPTAFTDDDDQMEQDADCGGETDDGACGDSEMLPLPFSDASTMTHSHSDGGSDLSRPSNSAQAFTARGSSLSDLASVPITDSYMTATIPSSASASASASSPAAFGLLRVDSAQRRSTISDKRAVELEFAALHGQHVCSTGRAAMGAYTYRGFLRGQQRYGLGQTTYDSGAVFVGEYRDDKCNGLYLGWQAEWQSAAPFVSSVSAHSFLSLRAAATVSDVVAHAQVRASGPVATPKAICNSTKASGKMTPSMALAR